MLAGLSYTKTVGPDASKDDQTLSENIELEFFEGDCNMCNGNDEGKFTTTTAL